MVAPVRGWAGSITARDWLESYTKKRVRKGEGGRIRLENTFAHGDGITRLDAKTSALSFGEAFRINLQNLISAGGMSSHSYSFRRSDARISSSHSDRLQYIDTIGRHFEDTGVTYLAQNRKAAASVGEKRDVDLRVDQIIAAVQICYF